MVNLGILTYHGYSIDFVNTVGRNGVEILEAMVNDINVPTFTSAVTRYFCGHPRLKGRSFRLTDSKKKQLNYFPGMRLSGLVRSLDEYKSLVKTWWVEC